MSERCIFVRFYTFYLGDSVTCTEEHIDAYLDSGANFVKCHSDLLTFYIVVSRFRCPQLVKGSTIGHDRRHINKFLLILFFKTYTKGKTLTDECRAESFRQFYAFAEI